MLRIRESHKGRRFFSLTIISLLVLNTLIIGITFEISNVGADSQTLSAGNLRINMLTDFGRIFLPLQWPGGGTFHTVSNGGFGYMGLVVDQQNYDHTPGSTDLADCYIFASSHYTIVDDFIPVTPIELIINTPEMDKMIGSFQNTGTTQDPNDILINLSAWSVQNKDWAILQWHVNNIKSPSADILNFKIGFEVDISQVGGAYGLGGDSGDDIDGFDVAEDVYWAQDNSGAGVCLGFASAIVTDPINHYYSQDYYPPTYDDYKTMWEDEDWLYGRISAPNTVEGANPGNRTSTVGWNGFTIPAGGSRTFTLVIAMNNTYNTMINAIKDAQWYYKNVLTGFLMTEFTDSGGSHQIEVYNNGREPTDTFTFDISIDGGSTFLTGTWNPATIQTYDYSVFTVTGGGSIGAHGDTIGFYENAILIEQISFGQEGIVPDPTPSMSVGRYYDPSAATYIDDWTHHLESGDTFGSQNNVGYRVTNPWVIVNRVMYNPSVSAEGYVEIIYRSFSPVGIDISNYNVVANDAYTILGSAILNVTNKFYVFCQSDMPAFFSNIDISGDNVYLYDASRNLLDMVGWSNPYTSGYFMSRSPDGGGTYQGYNDATSIAAGWVFDQLPFVMLTEFYADSSSAQIEVYSPRGGEIILDGRWSVQSSTAALNLAPNTGTIPRNGGYDYYTDSGGNTPGVEGDTFTLYYNPGSGQITMDQIGYGTHGIAPDPLSGESTSRFWDDYIPGYNDDWTRDIATSFGAQNDVPPINSSSFVILNEVMFNPYDDPTGKYFAIINRQPGCTVNISNYIVVSDAEYVLPDFPNTPRGFNGTLYPPGYPQNSVIIKFMDDTPNSDPFFQTMNDNAPLGDNVYFYDPNGRLLDMLGWNTQHTQGMSARRVPDGNGTHRGYNDITSIAAGWVFNFPSHVIITEFSDDEGTSQIEVYNPSNPLIDFSVGYTFENSMGTPLIGTWIDPIADSGEYGLFDTTSGNLDPEGDSIRLFHNGTLIEEISYGQNGVVPDPLSGESVQRYWDGVGYTNVWERNWFTGPNFGGQNDVPPANFSSLIILNEIMFNPHTPSDYFIEIFLLHGSLNISGYRIVCDSEYIIPYGIILNSTNPFFYLNYAMDPSFFNNMDSYGDNVYLYDDNGSLLDMAGWSSLHEQGWSMRRVPDGNGTRDGFDDASSIAAGWVFGNETEPPPPPSPPRSLIAVLINDAEDVLLTWNASYDDGAGDNDITGYSVYKSSTGVNGNFDFAAWIVANCSTSYNWIDIGAGDGDWNNYFYIVRANDTLDFEEQNTNKAGKFTNYLVKNWNLISVPLIQANMSMEYVLQTIEDNYTIVQGYHAGKSRPWLHHHKKKPKYFNDEIEINHKEGYYIKMIKPDYLIVAGSVPEDTHISLTTGWNLIGYPCLINKTRDDALSSISGKYNIVEYYDTKKGKEVRLGPDDFMQPGFGFWVHVTADCVLVL